MRTNPAINLVVVCGTTASAKTTLGVRIARELGGEIISVDSRQVYRGMDLGTGKDLGEYQGEWGSVAYHLIDIVDPSTVYTLHQYQHDFYSAFADIGARGKMPVAVGGTGLYLEAAIKGYHIPQTPENEALRDELMLVDKNELIARLERIDPDRLSKTDISSKKRIVRSLEVALSAVPNASTHQPHPEIQPLVFCVRWERSLLRERIRERLKQRLEAGMVDEVKRLVDQGISRKRLAMLGLEYRHVARFLSSEVSFETMVEELGTAIGQFAKRQETWFRGMERRGTPVHWIDNAEWTGVEAILREEGLLKGR